MLLADDVGLGKTIEAGLIITELIARRRASRILIVTPAGPLLEQWQVEMAERFGLRLVVADRTELERIRKGTELGTNPFDRLPMALASMDYLKQDRVLDWLERTRYDLVVLDEAHHYSESGAEDDDRGDASQRRKLALVLARSADALILLSATPHDGHDRSFAALLELLDRSLVDGRGQVRGQAYRDFVVRRLKRHVTVTDPNSGQPVGFPERQVIPMPVIMDDARYAAFLAAQRELLGFVAPELKRSMRFKRYDDALAYLALLKRSVSTAFALHMTVTKVRDRFRALATEAKEEADARRGRIRTLKALQRKAAKFGVLTPAEEAEREMMEVEDLAQQLTLWTREERGKRREADQRDDLAEQLDRVVDLAAQSLGQDPKLDAVIECIAAIRRDEPDASILIFTEYVDSLARVKERLEPGESRSRLDSPGFRRRAVPTGNHSRIPQPNADRPGLHRRCKRGAQPPRALPSLDPPGIALEPQPAGTAQRPDRPLRPVARAGRPLPLSQGDLRGAGPGPPGGQVRAAAIEAPVRAQHPGSEPAGSARRGYPGGPVPGHARDPNRRAGLPLRDHGGGPARRPRRPGSPGRNRPQPEAVRVGGPNARLARGRRPARRRRRQPPGGVGTTGRPPRWRGRPHPLRPGRRKGRGGPGPAHALRLRPDPPRRLGSGPGRPARLGRGAEATPDHRRLEPHGERAW